MELKIPRQANFSATIFRRGQKRELFEDAGEEAGAAETELTSKLGDLASLWAAERIGKDLSAALWRPALGLAEVVLQRGKAVAHLGIQQGSRLYLHPEEAAYLVDRANLLLFVEGPHRAQRLLSLQEAQDLMTGAGVGMDTYEVFCKLTRAGYIVQRHPARWVLGPRDSLVAAGAGGGPRQPDGSGAATPAGAPRPGAGVAPARDASASAPAPAPARAGRARRPQTRARAWWTLEAGAWLAPEAQEAFWASQPRAVVLQNPGAVRRARYPCLQPLAQTAAADLPHRPTAPSAAMLHLDVWGADAQFSRRGAGAPLFHVCVHPAGQCPSVQDMAAVEGAAGDIPVKFAVAEKGDIGFYGFSHVRLQDIL